MLSNKRFLRNVLLVVAVFSILLANAGTWAQEPLQSTEFTPGSWTLVLLPDTQNYSEQFPGLFTLQTHWIAKNKDKYNIRYVLGLGDITNGNTTYEWQCAQEAVGELDGKVPYVLATGNHDYTPAGYAITGNSGIRKFFPVAKFRDWPTFGGVMKEDDIVNSFHLFSAGGTDWIIIALEWSPRNEAVQWANDVLAKHPQRKAILVTHAYLYGDGTRYDFANKGQQGCCPHGDDARKDVNDGEELWQKLVRKNNFALVFSGHVGARNAGLLASKNDRGKIVYQMLVDYQSRLLGGEAYLRLLEFLPDGKTVHVKSYSPLYDRYLSDPFNQYSFELDP